MDATGLAIQLASGAVGGNVAGAVLIKFSLGKVGNSIVGIIGGGLGMAVNKWRRQRGLFRNDRPWQCGGRPAR